MKKEYTYQYPRPAVTTDCIIFGFNDNILKVMLIERGIEPYKGSWALPGGFVKMDETVEECAKRELREETGLDNIFVEQLYTFSEVNRDPRGRVISVAYYALVKQNDFQPQAGDDAKRAKWFAVNDLPSLAFDHATILEMALTRIRSKLKYQPIGFELLSEKFTMNELQTLYEAVLNEALDRRNFRRKMQKSGLLMKSAEKQENVAHRAAYFYKFSKERYEELSKKGFNFEI